jgi:hypothetical protein
MKLALKLFFLPGDLVDATDGDDRAMVRTLTLFWNVVIVVAAVVAFR